MSNVTVTMPKWTHPSNPNVDMCALAIDLCSYAERHMFKEVYGKNKTVQVLIDVPSASLDGDVPMGTCDNPCLEGVIPGMLTITVNPHQPLASFVDTVFHEMAHAEQIFEGRLNNSRIRCGENPTVRLWNKKAFSTRLMPYLDWPWEVEARDVATKMAEQMASDNITVAELVGA